MSLFFLPTKIIPPPCTQGTILIDIVYEVSAILAAKIQKIFENKMLSLKFTHYLI